MVQITKGNKQIEFKIDSIENLSLKEIKINNKRKHNNEKLLLDDSIKQVSGVYILFDKDKKVLYIGQTNRLRQRLCNHVSPDSNFRGKIHSYNGFNPTSSLPLGMVEFFAFVLEENKNRKNMIESIYMNIYNPKYNQKK